MIKLEVFGRTSENLTSLFYYKSYKYQEIFFINQTINSEANGVLSILESNITLGERFVAVCKCFPLEWHLNHLSSALLFLNQVEDLLL